jgi:hypothetical protein
MTSARSETDPRTCKNRRPNWGIKQEDSYMPMARKFSFTVNESVGELQLGVSEHSHSKEGEREREHTAAARPSPLHA